MSNLLLINPDLKFLLRQQCKQYDDVKSHNVIAEIKGTKFPEEIILVNLSGRGDKDINTVADISGISL